MLAKLWQTLAPRARATVFTMGDQYLPHGANAPRVDDARVAAWWAHNPSTRHPKLHAFPRGPWRTSGWAETLRAARRPRAPPPALLRLHESGPLRPPRQAGGARRNGPCARTRLRRRRRRAHPLRRRAALVALRRFAARRRRAEPPRLGSAARRRDPHRRSRRAPRRDVGGAAGGRGDELERRDAAVLEAEWRRMAGQEWAAEKIYFPFWLGKLLETVAQVGTHRSCVTCVRFYRF